MDCSFAFQPIVDAQSGRVFSQEALVRGPRGESAGSVFAQVAPADLHRFDRDCRAGALRLAQRLGLRSYLNLNALPRALLNAETGLGHTLAAAADCSFPCGQVILEVTEGELLDDQARFAALINSYRQAGMRFAIDDFGAGYSGLNLLAEFQPDFLKIDMQLSRGIHAHGPRQAIVRGIVQVCADLGIDVIAEGIETLDEYRWFCDEGVSLFQGYLFAPGSFESLVFPQVP